MMDRNTQNGRSMIEMLGVLAIVGVLSVGGIAGYSKAMLKYKVTKLTEQIITLNTNISTLFAQQKNYEGLDTLTAINSGIVPADMLSKTSLASNSVAEILHIFGGKINFFSATRNKSGDNLSHIITATKIPDDVCVQIVTTNWGEGKGKSNLAGLVIVADNRNNAESTIQSKLNVPNASIGGDRSNGRWAVFSPYSSQKWRLPATVATAAEVCNYDGYATIAWKYN